MRFPEKSNFEFISENKLPVSFACMGYNFSLFLLLEKAIRLLLPARGIKHEQFKKRSIRIPDKINREANQYREF